MTREQLAHLLRAASEIVGDAEVLVIGSQSVLGTFDEDDLPDRATASMEADLAFLTDDDDQKALEVEGAIGEWSMFHETFGIYAQGVGVATAVLPTGWRDRLVRWSSESTGTAPAVCLEPHDCVVSKLIAHREKDLAFAVALLEAQLISAEVLLARARALPEDVHPAAKDRVCSWVASWIARGV